jgi:hypothetical protein
MKAKVLPGFAVVTSEETFSPGDTLDLADKEIKRLAAKGVVESVKEVKEAK